LGALTIQPASQASYYPVPT